LFFFLFLFHFFYFAGSFIFLSFFLFILYSFLIIIFLSFIFPVCYVYFSFSQQIWSRATAEPYTRTCPLFLCQAASACSSTDVLRPN
jgi:hypothetical protein